MKLRPDRVPALRRMARREIEAGRANSGKFLHATALELTRTRESLASLVAWFIACDIQDPYGVFEQSRALLETSAGGTAALEQAKRAHPHLEDDEERVGAL